ncbi:MAG: hypothetical protein ABL901_18790 [Hyphomicrobiaceae bacterium]
MIFSVRFSLFLLGLTWASFAALAANDACFSDWSAASILVKAESLVPIEQLTKMAPSKLGGEIIRSTLCESKTGFIYKLVVRTANGQMKAMEVDAKHPFGK